MNWQKSSYSSGDDNCVELAAVPGPVSRLLADLREELADSAARDHWHGPDGPCPKCGGTDGMKSPRTGRPRRVIAGSH